MANRGGMEEIRFDTGDFLIQGYGRGFAEQGKVLTIYLEGDGKGWESRNRLSSDPTPDYPSVLQAATLDPRSKVLYLARPCQYTLQISGQKCNPLHWASNRYAEEIIHSIDKAIDHAKIEAFADRINLIGFSGGGTAAALVAARRSDVDQLTTVVANLDLAFWAKEQGISPLVGSLDPADFATRLAGIPQMHLAGAEDDIVPPSVLQSFLTRIPDKHNVRWKVMPGWNHHCCWVSEWKRLYREFLVGPGEIKQ